MLSRYLAAFIFCALLLTGFAPATSAQVDGNRVQRLEVMRSKLDGMRRSLNNAIANVNTKEGSDKEVAKNSPEGEALTRLRGLEREVSSVLTDVSALRVKVEKSEKYDPKEIETLEESVKDLTTRVDAGMAATAGVRKADATSTTARKKKKGKFLGLFGGGGDDNVIDAEVVS